MNFIQEVGKKLESINCPKGYETRIILNLNGKNAVHNWKELKRYVDEYLETKAYQGEHFNYRGIGSETYKWIRALIYPEETPDGLNPYCDFCGKDVDITKDSYFTVYSHLKNVRYIGWKKSHSYICLDCYNKFLKNPRVG